MLLVLSSDWSSIRFFFCFLVHLYFVCFDVVVCHAPWGFSGYSFLEFSCVFLNVCARVLGSGPCVLSVLCVFFFFFFFFFFCRSSFFFFCCFCSPSFFFFLFYFFVVSVVFFFFLYFFFIVCVFFFIFFFFFSYCGFLFFFFCFWLLLVSFWLFSFCMLLWCGLFLQLALFASDPFFYTPSRARFPFSALTVDRPPPLDHFPLRFDVPRVSSTALRTFLMSVRV